LISISNTRSFTSPTRDKIRKTSKQNKKKRKEGSKKKSNKEEPRDKRKSLPGREEFRSNLKK